MPAHFGAECYGFDCITEIVSCVRCTARMRCACVLVWPRLAGNDEQFVTYRSDD